MRPTYIQEQVSLAPYTTMGVGGCAEYFACVTEVDQLKQVVLWAKSESLPVTIIGGGSNVVVDDNGVRGLVVHLQIEEVTYVEKGDTVLVTAGAGKILDTLVEELVENGVWGLENLSAIPGTVGAVPIQNVGAYGVEAKDCIHEVEVYDMVDSAVHVFDVPACQFAYRHSLFKTDAGKRYIVLRVTFALTRTVTPRITYKDLAHTFKDTPVPTLRDIRDALIGIRAGKFPDWHTLGTAGSFFKNPIISKSVFDALIQKYPDMVGYPEGSDTVKVSLGWILDHVLNYKGYRVGNVGLYEKQALVLVQYGGATSSEVYTFAASVCDAVKRETGIVVEYEAVHLT